MASTTIRNTTSAPTWAVAHDESNGIIRWSSKVRFDGIEVDGPDSLTVEAYLFDNIEVADDGVSVERGTPEIQLTRSEVNGEEEGLGFPIRFELTDARRVAATILELCQLVEAAQR